MIDIGDYVEFDDTVLIIKILKDENALVIISPNDRQPGYTFYCSIGIVTNQGGKKVTDKDRINMYNKLEVFQ